MREKEIKRAVKEGYARIAKRATSYYSSRGSFGCGDIPEEICKKMGYSDEDLKAAPPESNLGLGCGNPVALAAPKDGETVLDMGSGAGFDCFLAATRVGSKGKVIGVDITSEMVEKARSSILKSPNTNIDFRQGDLENMPVADKYCDVVISNCVINLVPNKKMVFREAYRVLKPGGRLAVSDVVLKKDLPEFVKNSNEAYICCLAGAIMKEEYLKIIKDVGFKNVEVVAESIFPIESLISKDQDVSSTNNPNLSKNEQTEIADSVLSIKVRAIKPAE